MKRMLWALAVAAGWAAAPGAARADWGGYSPAGGPAASAVLPEPGQIAGPGTLFGAGAASPGQAPSVYGFNPHLRKAFKLGGGCDTCGKGGLFGGKGGAPMYAGPSYMGPSNPQNIPVMQGTLAFPHHPFVRSPRDFFMYEPNR